MKVDELEALVANKPIKAVYIVPTFATWWRYAVWRRAVNSWWNSKRYDFVIIEDDPYSEINYTDEVFRPLIAHAKDIGNEENVVPQPSVPRAGTRGLGAGAGVLKRAVVT